MMYLVGTSAQELDHRTWIPGFQAGTAKSQESRIKNLTKGSHEAIMC